MESKLEKIIGGAAKLELPPSHRIGGTKSLSANTGISVKSVRCALRGAKHELSIDNYTRVRRTAIAEYGAYPVKSIRLKIE